MKHIEVLGFGCATCNKTFERIAQVARERGIDIRLEKVNDPARIAACQVLRPPGVVVDGRLVFSGGIPGRALIEGWLAG